MSEPGGTPPGLGTRGPAVLGRGDLLPRVTFLVAMAMLGVAGAVVLIRQSSPAPPTAPHRTLDSPYQAMPFHRGQPQAQSTFGAGRSYPRDVSRAYERLGYAWVSITDVNTATPTKTYDTPDMVTVGGDAASYPFADFIALGVVAHEPADTAQQAIDWVHRGAGVIYLARPLVAPSLSYESIAALKGLDGIEIYDARTATDQPTQADASALWDRLLSDHHRLWGLVGDDTITANGQGSTLGQTSVDVQVASLIPPLINDALRRGAFVDSSGVRILGVDASDGVVTVITTNADQITFIGSGGRKLATIHGVRGEYRVAWTEGYVRAVASRQSDGAEAWTQPVFVIP